MERYKLDFFDNLIVQGSETNVSSSVNEIIVSIKKQAFKLNSEEELRLFIQNNQRSLLLFIKLRIADNSPEKILYFLESHFPDYINGELETTSLTRDEFLKDYVREIKAFEKNMNENLDRKLLLVVKPVFEPENTKNFTCHHKAYLSQFWDRLLGSYLRASDIENHDFINFLLQANYNSPAFFSYYTDLVVNEISFEEENAVFRLEILKRHLQRIKTVYPITNTKLVSRVPDIGQLLENWLSYEIKQAKSRHKAVNPEQSKIEFPTQTQKIQTTLSVPQISFLFRMMRDLNIITNDSHTDILNTASRFLASKKQGHISFGSLYSKYYNVSDTTKESLKNILLNIIKNI